MSSNRNFDISSFDLTLMSAGTGLVLLIVALATAVFTEISLGMIALVFVIVLLLFEAGICYHTTRPISRGRAVGSSSGS